MNETRSSVTNGQPRRIGSVSNALRVLRALAERPSGVGVTQLADLIGVGKSSAHLLLATLAEQDFVAQGADGRYRLGVAAFEVGAAAGGMASSGGPLTPLLRELADRCEEAVSLATRSGRDAIILQRIESASILRAEIGVGTRMPLHSSASGKYLLASMPGHRLDALYPGETLPEITSFSLRSKADLLDQLAIVRQRNYASNDEEYNVGISAVATGVVDANDSVTFALSIAGPTHRFRPDGWLDDLIDTANEMSEVLRGLAPVVLPETSKNGGSPAGAGPRADAGARRGNGAR